MNLIIGATGLLGSEICRHLTAQGEAVTALVRDTSGPEKVAQLKSLGAELVRGDLKDLPSLKAACCDVRTVVSTASSTLSRQGGDSIDTVDRLRRSRMTHTILQPTCFMEVWLSPALGFDPANGKAQIYGEGRNKTSWISFQDVARFAVAALDNPHATNATVKLGGPDALSPLEVVRVAEQSVGKPVVVQHVPEEALRAQLSASPDPLQQSFAGLMLYYARGDVVDMTDTIRAFQVDQLKSVRAYFKAAV